MLKNKKYKSTELVTNFILEEHKELISYKDDKWQPQQKIIKEKWDILQCMKKLISTFIFQISLKI